MAPLPIFAASKAPFYYGAWLPFWKQQGGAQEVALNLEKFKGISPFSYEVNSDGTLKDSLKITEGFWPVWLKAAKDMGIKVTPSIATFDDALIYKLLSSKKLRQAHEANIVAMVKARNFDGVDIDYENKTAETKDYFSAFIKELSGLLHAKKKILTCTVESRTPNDARFTVVPVDISYANDYAVLNKYCDEVRIMAYDQGAIDLQLNSQKGNGQLYMPVADPDWVEKVIKLAIKSISPKKLMLGVPTYGYVYEVSQASGIITYKRLRSVTYDQMIALASSTNSTPVRNSATGELTFSYATSTSVSVSKNLTFTIQSPIQIALASSQSTMPVSRFVSFSDANAIADKIKLAKKYGLKGITIFKMDGEVDPNVWSKIK